MKGEDTPERDRPDAHQKAARDARDAGEPRGLDPHALLAKAEDAPEPFGSDIRDLVALVRAISA